MSTAEIQKFETKTIQTVDLIEAWIDYERMRGQTEGTLAAYRRSFDRFTEWIRERGIKQPGARDIAKYKFELAQDYAVQTVNLSLCAVRSFYRYLVTQGSIPYSPAGDVPGVKRPKSRRHKRAALTGPEVRAVLETCDDTIIGVRDRLIITLMAYCGLRTIEVHRLDVDHLATEADRMILHVQGKGHREPDEIAVIPKNQEPTVRAWMVERRKLGDVSDALIVSLSKRSKGRRLSNRSIREIVTGHYKKAGVVGADKSTHSLRHSAITQAIKAGASPMQAQAMARHASFDTTLGYIHEVNRLENPAEDLIEY
jgi:site-specific recombinase XerD